MTGRWLVAIGDRNANQDGRQRRAIGALLRKGALSESVGPAAVSGTVDGVNADFALADAPVDGSLMVFVNGLLMSEGSGEDYVLAGQTITFQPGAIPQSGDKIRVFYRRQT
ncbi:hypothetical protein [Fontivita pretiosa]|uniref:hypothetical protein n=1 Tax=Fontivita pretiosa TaxID=2989684 RepID=UPI003D1781C5